jgi:hypothetical protein
MNRKHNPIVSMIALVLLGAILVLAFSGCTRAEAAQQHRFTYEWAGWAGSAASLYILTDTQTGVQYLIAEGSGTSLIVLQPRED